ncbi:MAG: hypothetical protein LBL66_07935 [Clostridiales bacterium]|jgi:hypothetical protein|nr:hypothetical protein [Clostridiales bacterium]
MKKTRILRILLAFALTAAALTACAKKPDAPVIERDGATIGWAAVKNAESYDVYINDGHAANVTETSYTVTETEPGAYTVKVKSVAGKNSSPFSNEVICIVTGQLAKPALTVNGGAVGWPAIPNATGYVVKLDGAAQEKQTALTFTVSAAGAHTVTVKAIGDGEIWSDSAESDSVQVTVDTRLATPANLAIGNLSLSWDASPGNEGYAVTIKFAGAADIVKQAAKGVETLLLTDGDFASAGAYAVEVIAKGDGVATTDSAAASIAVTRLAKPAVTLNGKIISWQPVVGALSYDVYIDGDRKAEGAVSPWTFTDGQIDTSYAVYVVAVGNGANKLNGVGETQMMNVTSKLASPANIVYNTGSGVLSWDAVEDATGYRISADNDFSVTLPPDAYEIAGNRVNYFFTAAPGVYGGIGVAALADAPWTDSDAAGFADDITLVKSLQIYYYNPNTFASPNPQIDIHTNNTTAGQTGSPGGAFLLNPPASGSDVKFPFAASGDGFFRHTVTLRLSAANSVGAWEFSLAIGEDDYDLDMTAETGSRPRNGRRTVNFDPLNEAGLWDDAHIGVVYLVVGIDVVYTDREAAYAAAVNGVASPSRLRTGVITANFVNARIYTGQDSVINFAGRFLTGKVYYLLGAEGEDFDAAYIKANGTEISVTRRLPAQAAADLTEEITGLGLGGAGVLYFVFEDLYDNLGPVTAETVEIVSTAAVIQSVVIDSIVGVGQSTRATVRAGRAGTLYYLISQTAGLTAADVKSQGVPAAITLEALEIPFTGGVAGSWYFYAVLVCGNEESALVTENFTVNSDIRIESVTLPKAVFPGYTFDVAVEATKEGTLYYLISGDDSLDKRDVIDGGQTASIGGSLGVTLKGLDIGSKENKYLYLVSVSESESTLSLQTLNVADEAIGAFAELKALIQKTGTINAQYYLTDDIYCTEAFAAATNSVFTGAIYGNGYAVYGLSLTYTSSSDYSRGLFAEAGAGAQFHDLIFVDASIAVGNEAAHGLLAGQITGGGGTVTVDNVAVIGFTMNCAARSRSSGGLFGNIQMSAGAELNLDITNCYVEFTLTGVGGHRRAGGLIGEIQGRSVAVAYTVNVTNTYVKFTTSESGSDKGDAVGGLIGRGAQSGNGVNLALTLNYVVIEADIKNAGNAVNTNGTGTIFGAFANGGLSGSITADNVIFIGASQINRIGTENASSVTFTYDGANPVTGTSSGMAAVLKTYADIPAGYLDGFADNGGWRIYDDGGTDRLAFVSAEIGNTVALAAVNGDTDRTVAVTDGVDPVVSGGAVAALAELDVTAVWVGDFQAELFVNGVSLGLLSNGTKFGGISVTKYYTRIEVIFTQLFTVAIESDGVNGTDGIVYEMGNGTFTVKRGGGDVASGDKVPNGSSLTVAATPDEGYVAELYINDILTENLTVAVTGDVKIEVVFVGYTVTVTGGVYSEGVYTAADGTFTVAYSDGEYTVNVASGDKIAGGTVLTVTAEPESGFTAKLYVNDVPQNGLTAAVGGHLTIEVVFTAVPTEFEVAITIVNGGGGTVTVTDGEAAEIADGGSVLPDTALNVTAEFDPDSFIAELFIGEAVEGIPLANGVSYEITDSVGADISIKVVFTQLFTVTIESDGVDSTDGLVYETGNGAFTVKRGGGSDVASGDKMPNGSSLIVAATPDAGYTAKLYVNDSLTENWTVTVTSDIKIEVVFVGYTVPEFPDDGVLITNAVEFQAMLTSPVAGTKYYIVNDIDLTGETLMAGTANFSGQLIGWNGSKIIGLTLTSRGMFNQIQNGAAFKDLILVGPRMNVSSGIGDPKGLLGISVKSGTVTLDNVMIVDFIMTVTGGESNASGGLFGETNPGNSDATAIIITNSYIDVRMEGDGNFTRAGGIIGRMESNGAVSIEITDSYIRYWRREGGGRAGGIVGNGSDGALNLTMTRVAVGIITNNNGENGGLIGHPQGLSGAVTLANVVYIGTADLNRICGNDGDTTQTFTYDGGTAAKGTALKTVADTAYIGAFADGNGDVWEVDGGALVFLPAVPYLE